MYSINIRMRDAVIDIEVFLGPNKNDYKCKTILHMY